MKPETDAFFISERRAPLRIGILNAFFPTRHLEPPRAMYRVRPGLPGEPCKRARAGPEHRRSARQRPQEAWHVPGELGPWEPQGGLGTRDGLPCGD